MLSGISSYIFGATEDQSVPDNENVQLQTSDAENEWVLVDIAEKATSTGQTTIKTFQSPSDSDDNQAVPLPNVAPDESWFVTPPSCFTAGGHSPVHMEPNPLEDLLIEHPSMSVYGPRTRRQSSRTHSNSSAVSSQSEPSTSHTVAQRPPRRAAAVSAQLGIKQQQAMAAKSQKQEQVQTYKNLSRNKMHRANKVYQQQSFSRRQRKKDLVSKHCMKVCKNRC
ncbi:uncharacterized protein LOC100370659 [Saccoglossus kowalevskii]|uniref:Tumor protein p53-inducible nuclear protein 2-like n=1 Tax=Saccoglossus kowalevskii TaxID=10224 RepID=A0ABM0GQV3_SACKO|nr:PREDICTED: tumor protein p53-inducible nuclear protein 2-like [Saccoglossus kowalevskii]